MRSIRTWNKERSPFGAEHVGAKVQAPLPLKTFSAPQFHADLYYGAGLYTVAYDYEK